MRGNDITVVKLGGSFASSQHLRGWLDALAGCGGRIVVVAGGGPFADVVRQAQKKMGFDDTAAHHLALIAMEQFGLALANLRPSFSIAASAAAIRRIIRSSRVPVWSPTAMVLRQPEILPSWEVTSDSLAAWLAGHIGSRRLVLVKHGGPFGDPVRAIDLVERGIVDRAFPRFLGASGVEASIVAASDHAGIRKVISSGGTAGSCIDLHEQGTKRLPLTPWPRSRRHAGDGR